MNLILVGTDFSEDSVKAQDKAAEIAVATGADLYLLHVLEPVDDPDSDDPSTQEFYEKLKNSSQEKLVNAADKFPDLKVEYSTEVGHRHPTILARAEAIQADLIVLGSKPITPEQERIGTSHRVAVTSTRPVLLVP